MTEVNPALAALRRMAQKDSRPPALPMAAGGPSLFAFVACARERIAGTVLPRPSLVVVLEGAKELVAMGRPLRVGAGHAVALPAGWQGDVVNDPDPDTGFYRAIFLDFAETLVLGAHRAHPEWRVAAHGRRAEVALDPLLTAAIHHAAEGIAGGLPPLLVEHRQMEILLILGMRGVLPLRPGAGAASSAEAVRALVRWQPDRAWTADLLAAELGTSNATLRRRLAREGQALRALLAEERTALGRRMLREDGASLREAALAAGYLSPRRFAERLRATASGRHGTGAA
ncbi:helix-turn-helix domain-containing protein [Labrys wisconsinensis]|uniref:AraC-like DNA-binding protein n=1 Tax=Labrys wisconsinensis TaxID=425677 RepID=A0ABU0JPA1_9HYPH|nr:AraC family transcriptional regulator [Labrys wisconsinensis]MDQ0474977.1 AraC-like DNA-binding protein [Labrys wisconsinensis]